MKNISIALLLLLSLFWWIDFLNISAIDEDKKESLFVLTFICFVWYRIEFILLEFEKFDSKS